MLFLSESALIFFRKIGINPSFKLPWNYSSRELVIKVSRSFLCPNMMTKFREARKITSQRKLKIGDCQDFSDVNLPRHRVVALGLFNDPRSSADVTYCRLTYEDR